MPHSPTCLSMPFFCGNFICASAGLLGEFFSDPSNASKADADGKCAYAVPLARKGDC